MGRHHEATARELEFEFLEGEVSGSGHAGSASVSICVVCGRARARKSLDHYHGRAPAKLCLRCHDAASRVEWPKHENADTTKLSPKASSHWRRGTHSPPLGAVIARGKVR